MAYTFFGRANKGYLNLDTACTSGYGWQRGGIILCKSAVPVSHDDARIIEVLKLFPQFPALVKQLRYSTIDSSLDLLIAEIELYRNDSSHNRVFIGDCGKLHIVQHLTVLIQTVL